MTQDLNREALESRASELLAAPFPLVIGGREAWAHNGTRVSVLNPATGRPLADAAQAGVSDVEAAVTAAAAAFPAWRRLSPQERAERILALARRIEAATVDLAILDALDCGNPVRDMVTDVKMAVGQLEYFAGLALEMKGETVPASAGNLHFTLREPFGVVARIVPYNHPILFAAARIAAPLIAGNTVVLKPAEQTPLSALYLARLAQEVLPPGVLNVVNGGPEVGGALVAHPQVGRIAFTGGTGTARAVLRCAADYPGKAVTLELGGKNPMIIYPDADLDTAAAAAAAGMNFKWCQGQSCGSTSRVLVHSSVHKPFLERVHSHVSAIRIGEPIDPATEMGCLVSGRHLERCRGYVKIGNSEGAKLVYGGGSPANPALAGGYFMEPTIFDGVTSAMTLAKEEIFGPILSVMTWDNSDAIMSLANSLPYGLTASIWTQNLKQALTAAMAVEAGYVWINGVSRHFPGTPFGGYKGSGVGREECLEELLSFTQTKAVHVFL